jgi:hypothetical protein
MPGGIIFEYKCEHGHKSSQVYPWRTPYDKHAQKICLECQKAGLVKWAYLIFACPEPPEKKNA